MSGSLLIKNRQRLKPLNPRLLRKLVNSLLIDLSEIPAFNLGISIVRTPEMARLNETFLNHKGSTDVITFDYANPVTRNTQHATRLPLHGEIFISMDDAIAQARKFRTTWQSELIRYIIHGILHLQGFNDLHPAARRKMKREENRLLKEITRLFPLRLCTFAPLR